LPSIGSLYQVRRQSSPGNVMSRMRPVIGRCKINRFQMYGVRRS
jgi:hypothetical protein